MYKRIDVQKAASPRPLRTNHLCFIAAIAIFVCRGAFAQNDIPQSAAHDPAANALRSLQSWVESAPGSSPAFLNRLERNLQAGSDASLRLAQANISEIWDSLPDERQRQLRRALREKQRAQWQSLSEEEREELRAQYENMSEEEQEQQREELMREVLQEEGIIGGTADRQIGEVDHAGIIRNWDEEDFQKGKQIYTSYCYTCHGMDGTAALPTARSFNKDELKAGNDPYTMWKTLTDGFNQMLPQKQYRPDERYAVIHYIREAIIKPTNRGEYFEITDEYLDSLPKGTKRSWEVTAGEHPRDYGPALISQYTTEFTTTMNFKFGDGYYMNYDLHRMKQLAAWNGFLDLSSTFHMRQRGEGMPVAKGTVLEGLQTYHWAYGDSFDEPERIQYPYWIDPHQRSRAESPLPDDMLDYHGHYIYWNKVALSYDILGRGVMEMPELHKEGDMVMLAHTIKIEPGETPLRLCVGKYEAGPGSVLEGVFPLVGDGPSIKRASATNHMALAGKWTPFNEMEEFVAAGVAGQTQGFEWEVDDRHRLGLHIAPSTEPRLIRVFRYAGVGSDNLKKFATFVDKQAQMGELGIQDLEIFKRGGPRRYKQIMEVKGDTNVQRFHYIPGWRERGVFGEEPPQDSGRRRFRRDREQQEEPQVKYPENYPFQFDDIPIPADNPWNAWIRTTDLDFFEDGRCAVSTYTGDIWVVSDIDDTLESVKWQRFATGLSEPMGINVIDGKIYAMCRDGIYRFHDFNNDGEADYYELFFEDFETAGGFHAFNFCLETDEEGYIYFNKPGRYTDYTKPGGLIKVSPDGEEFEILCRGLRVPNGLSIDPKGKRIYIAGQEGEWTPASKLTKVPLNTGEMPWLGVSQTDFKPYPDFVQPMVWFPKEFDRSSGGQVIAYDDRLGPLNGMMVHTCFSRAWLIYVMREEVDGVEQGAGVALPYQFYSGIHRVAFNPVDGGIYAVGLTGWDTEPALTRDGCLGRIRYVDRKAYMVTETHVKPDGIQLVFSCEIDPQSASSVENYEAMMWNYKWTSDYGSEHWSAMNPGERGEDSLPISEAVVGADNRSVLLKMPDLMPVDTVHVRFRIKADDGKDMEEYIYLTVNKIPESALPPSATVSKSN